MAAIRVDELSKSYGSVRAVDGMQFSVDRGELYGFLGPNGAGKTTTIRAITGQVRPDSGTISVLGTDPVAEPLETRRRVGILPERGSPPSFLTPQEYLSFVGRVRDLEPDVVEERIDRWADRLGFRGKLETLHTDLSRGQQQKLMIAQAFLHEPDVVLIDEPLANLDPIVQEQVKQVLVDYAARDNAVFVSTHNIDVAEAICSRVGIVADGRIVAERRPDADDQPLLETFLEHVDRTDPRDMPSKAPIER
ncbi:ABC transporter ATP-binding protein [Halopiger goleimassiliensis]|uniref:ABC transporter ATP-binding protein n=1 Tax=Halopiger goleimassiliensis TaxID=1293048 RepID=UPI000677F7F1|nr:ABC transporter ATP-binding protein [Halopiger goleimassiliensis]